jgi:hypothetical protein
MGEAAARKVTEIDEGRRQLETDLLELEARLPAALRSSKALLGVVVGSATLTALLIGRRRSKRTDAPPAAEVVVRIVREDGGP